VLQRFIEHHQAVSQQRRRSPFALSLS